MNGPSPRQTSRTEPQQYVAAIARIASRPLHSPVVATCGDGVRQAVVRRPRHSFPSTPKKLPPVVKPSRCPHDSRRRARGLLLELASRHCPKRQELELERKARWL